MKQTRTGGFTLLELMMAVMIMTIMVSMLYTIFQTTMQVWGKADSKVEMMQNARVFLDKLAADLDTITIQDKKDINCIINQQSILFVCKGIYSNGSSNITGYQEIEYSLTNGGASDYNFTDDSVDLRIRHSHESAGFSFETDFTTLQSQTASEMAAYVVDLEFECWNDMTDAWIDWSAWPGSPSSPAWNVLSPVSSHDPDHMNYQPSDPSNRGVLPQMIRITMRMVQPDTAAMLASFSTSAFNSYTQGQSGTNREKAMAELEERGLLYEYSIVVSLPHTQ